MSDDPRRVVTQEALDRLHLARNRGGLCAACGKALHLLESVYWDRLVVDIDPPAIGSTHYSTVLEAPVGVECASPEMLEQTRDRQPERCAGCRRGVYYDSANPKRRRALCSRHCASRASMARRRARAEEAQG